MGFTSPQPIVGRVYPSTLAFYLSKGRVDGSLDEAVCSTIMFAREHILLNAGQWYHYDMMHTGSACIVFILPISVVNGRKWALLLVLDTMNGQ